jgi:hypothetical protein
MKITRQITGEDFLRRLGYRATVTVSTAGK